MLRTPLYIVQSVDLSAPAMPVKIAAKLMNKANPKDTGRMHGFLPVHEGMRIRLIDALDLKRGLVKDAEGEIVKIVVNPLDQDGVDDAHRNGAGILYLQHLPLGLWVRMEKYKLAPFVKQLRDFDDGLSSDDTRSLVFIEPKTSDAFIFCDFKVVRTSFPISHARVITCTACQGRTMHAGVVIDAARHETGNTKKENDDWWLDLYVMLSRATRLEDLLVIRAPPVEFLLQGPPSSLKRQLQKLAARTSDCRKAATTIATDLGFDQFFRDT